MPTTNQTNSMAKFTFKAQDVFNFKNGSGIVLEDGISLMIVGKGGRSGYKHEKGPIPEDAIPGEAGNFEVKFALETAAQLIRKD